jgi:hypothetical protein
MENDYNSFGWRSWGWGWIEATYANNDFSYDKIKQNDVLLKLG